MRCHACGAGWSGERVGVRELCARCGAWLHCCRNCDFYEPGLANDCREPGAARVVDKVAGNFCDWFRPGTRAAAGDGKSTAARRSLDALFRKGR